MKSKKNFSKFIMVSLTLVMGGTFFLTATGIFLYRINKLRQSGETILELSQMGFSDTLSKHFDHVREGLVNVAADTSIKNYVVNNDWLLLSDILNARYAYDAKRRILVYDSRNHRFIPELPAGAPLDPALEMLNTRNDVVNIFQKTDDDRFISIFSMPMMKDNTRIATALLLYDITKDYYFWDLLQSTRITMNRILIKTADGRLFNLETGEEVAVPEEKKEGLFTDTGAPLKKLFPGEALLPVSGFPGIYYAGNVNPMNEQIAAVKTILIYLCILILVITVCVSYFIAKVVSKPLENMAEDAILIAREPSNITLNEEKVEYLEFQQLAHAFNQVLLNLFATQEKLKAEAGEEKKRLEEELHRAMKMEAVGAMAGGVAHDLNNILSGIVSYPELLLMDLPGESPLRKPILSIKKSGEKAAAIVQDMVTLARRNINVTEVVNLNALLLDHLKSPEHRKMMSDHPGVSLKTDLEPNLLNMAGSGVHLSKTLMNLIANALEAMPRGGTIHISTRNEYIDFPVSGYDTVNEGDYIALKISDNGVGIAPADRGKIFEPFYTKKKMGRSGTGLGMAVVWGTVKDHNGYIDLQSQPGAGTTFTLYFPMTRKELIEKEADAMIDRYMGKGETVLVVDDVQDQREIATGMLTRLGYQVATASSGEEAVEYMKTHAVDILVLDMIMAPGIDGLETYKRILEIRPGQKALVASGFSETERVRDVQALGAGAYVKKPYLLKNIGPAMRSVLDA